MALFNREQLGREPQIAGHEHPSESPQPSTMKPIHLHGESEVASVKPAGTAGPDPGAQRKPAFEGQAYLDRGCKISGKLEFEDAVCIDGQIEGEIVARDNLFIGESAVLTAKIKASSVVVAGTVSGEIAASGRIEIRASAKVSGNVTTPKLIVHEGAVFEGYCAMQADSAHKERKLAEPEGGNGLAARVHDHKQAP